ncbi:MAG TPA: hypothetical protein PLN35_00435, partial [Quisquiliibacterium sp.]|nr:hypothetical protein [Quisquiliibacterium sp.]
MTMTMVMVIRASARIRGGHTHVALRPIRGFGAICAICAVCAIRFIRRRRAGGKVVGRLRAWQRR